MSFLQLAKEDKEADHMHAGSQSPGNRIGDVEGRHRTVPLENCKNPDNS